MVTKAQLQRDYAGLEERVRALELQVPSGPLPDGKYRVTIVGAELRVSRVSERKYWQLKLRVEDPPYRGRFLWVNYVQSGISHDELVKLCRALLEVRVTWEDRGNNPVHDLVGKEATATVRISGYATPLGARTNDVRRLVP